MAPRVAVVTGSNKGIGFAIVRALCKEFNGDVYLTARDENRGQDAVKQLNNEGLSPKFHQLDIDDNSSIERLRDFLQDTYGGLDVLVNNAGIAFKVDSTAPFPEQAEVTIKTNFWSTLNVCDKLFPILKPHARVCNVSSMGSQMSIAKCSPELKAKFKDPKLTMDGLKKLMEEFVSLAKENKHVAAGWPNTAYGVSKIGVTVMSFIQQKELEGREDIIVNACCPGYVATDMSSFKGPKTIDQGAETPVMLALIPPGAASPRGKYLSEKTVQNWG
ncbi:carbonyl reductase [NADPH] 1-like [Pomacea canaliculata]|uniref:carbonyl reductase [NADPH] 1-like n=1 Tax=Pomacea canaliculata TaxID=400727 RepID=UPI000D72EB82|nr:carbonyl reductase [NADPH] 1-like [Pomacea canaliculata]XP_025088759.1 carbonyl reductase [NADPH] 1-like [Pomacea canaliculata]